MVKVPVNEVNLYGVIRETPLYKLPAAAWQVAENVRLVGQGIGVYGMGYKQVFGTPTAAPQFLLPVKDSSQTWWIYMSAIKGFVFGSAVHTEITRESPPGTPVNYTASTPKDWNGTILGGIPIINNGLDIPQFWANYTIATKLADLTNWPATLRAKVVRALGPFLIAANLTESGTAYPHRVRTSHPAAPGSVPLSWDPADATKDVRQVDLPDVNSGLIVEMLPLREAMYVYKESSIHRFRPTGSRSVFNRDTLSETVGCLTTRCAAITGDGQMQVAFSVDDMIVHDGVQVKSLLTNRMRRQLFNQINELQIKECFMFPIPTFNEIVFMYPEVGYTIPNRALVWNYSRGMEGAFTEMVLPAQFVAAAEGDLTNVAPDTWDILTNTWEGTTMPWNTSARRKVVLADNVNTKFFHFDADAVRDGDLFVGTIRREGLPLFDVDEQGNPVVDFTTIKLFTRIWPKIEGGIVEIRVGFSDTVNGVTTWTPAVQFDPSTQVYVDLGPITGRAMGLEISGEGQWLLTGYTVEVFPAGEYTFGTNPEEPPLNP